MSVARFIRVALLACALQAGIATLASAQGVQQAPALPDPEETGRFRLGPIRYTPSLVLSSLGVDTNVFNQADDPQQDFTTLFGPKVEFWTRLGPRARLYGNTGVHYQYFQKYDSQRSFGTSDVLRLDVDLGRLMPFVEGQYTNTRIRPGFEIDARARLKDLSGRAGVSVRVQGKTELQFWARNGQFRYDAGEEFLDVELGTALNRDSKYYGSGVRFELTPLTTFVIEGETGTDRFVLSPERDANTYKIMPAFKFKPFALIDGTLSVGYRNFETVSAAVPDFGGVVALVDLGYTLRATRVAGQFRRDVTYSFETLEPYYLQTDWAVSVTQKITSTWDVVGRVGRYALDYERVGLPGQDRRTDNGHRRGVGVGYALGRYVRLGFDVDYVDRRSTTDVVRNYDGVRAGFGITYGIRQR